MAKITLGKRPATIVRTVKAPLLDGTEGSMQVHYRYRTRQEWGELIDRRTAEARERNAAREEADRTARSLQQLKDEPIPDTPFSVATLQAETVAATAGYIMEIVDGWNLDEPFDLEAVTQLCDELPGMAQAIVDDYRAAITEGRLGN